MESEDEEEEKKKSSMAKRVVHDVGDDLRDFVFDMTSWDVKVHILRT